MAIKITDKLNAATESGIVADSTQIAGGYITVSSLSDRDNLSEAIKLSNAIIYVSQENTKYQYRNGEWVNLNLEEALKFDELYYDSMVALRTMTTADNFIIIPKGETESGTWNGSNVKVVVFPTSLLRIEQEAYRSCSQLASVRIPSSVTFIGSFAFENCTSLTSITLPNSVTSIGDSAFDNCNGLTSVHISSIESWCNISFGIYTSNPLYYAGNLYLNGTLVTELVIPDSVTSIRSHAFGHCTGLTSITIPDSVTNIGFAAFSGCSGLTSVTIGNSVTEIDYEAFSGCSGLTSITIPDSVTFIGQTAFADCTGLTSFNYNGTMEEWGAISKGKNWARNIPAAYVQCTDGQVAI